MRHLPRMPHRLMALLVLAGSAGTLEAGLWSTLKAMAIGAVLILAQGAGEPVPPPEEGGLVVTGGLTAVASLPYPTHPHAEIGVIDRDIQITQRFFDIILKHELAVADTLSQVKKAPRDERPGVLEKGMRTIRARSRVLVQAMNDTTNWLEEVSAGFAAKYPGIALEKAERAGHSGDSAYNLYLSERDLLKDGIRMFDEALRRYHKLFEPAIRDLVPQRSSPAEDDDHDHLEGHSELHGAFRTGPRLAVEGAPADGRFLRRDDL